MGISVRGIVSSAALLASVLSVRPAVAQVVPSLPGASRPAGAGSVGAAALGRRLPDATRLVLEGAVDPDQYIVGPGDEFTVSIGGSVPRQVTSVVSADGRLVIPEAGSFVAAGRTLARVRADAQSALQRRYQNVTAEIALSSPRQFYVHVSGSVPTPGRHSVPAVARVEDAVVEAGGAPISDLAKYTEGASQKGLRWPALRSVSVTRRSGSQQTVDLMRYVATGDLAANPYLQDGDALYVPSFDPLVEGVAVGGAVDRPGTYDVRPGDTAQDLLVVASGASTRIARVRRVRAGEAVREVSFAEAATLDVRPQDQVYAVPADPDADRAQVVGAVRYPGSYPITEGQTTLEALVTMAGGLRDDALLRGATLERPPRADVARPASESPAGADDTVSPDVSVETDLLGGLFGRQYFVRQSQRVPRVSIDPEAAVSGTQSVRLRGGDVLTIPFDYGLVRVYGRVQRTGYVPYVAGTTAGDYVAQAGGLGTTAAQVYVVDAATGQLAAGTETVVRPGDAVFVNSLPTPDTAEFAQLALQERQDARDDARDRRQSRYQLFQTVLSVVGTVTAVVVAYFTAQAVNKN